MKNHIHQTVIKKLDDAYAYHKVIYDVDNHPVDYVFLDVNESFEKVTGLVKENILNKSVSDVIPDLEMFWIKTYGLVASEEGREEQFTHYSGTFNTWFNVKVFCPEQGYFVTLFEPLQVDLGKLQQSKALSSSLANLVKVAPIPIMLHAEGGHVLAISDAWTKITGYRLEDIPTTAVWTEKAYGPDKAQDVMDFINDLYKLEENLHDGEFVIRTKLGKERLWDFYSSFVGRFPNGDALCMSAAIDITDIKQAERKLEYSQEIAQLYLDVTTQLLIVLDKDATIVMINKAGCQILEDTEENIVGQNWFDHYILPDMKDEIQTVFDHVFHKNGTFAVDYINDIITAKGNVRTLHWHNTLIRDIDGNIVQILSSAQDITEQQRYQDQLVQMSYTDVLTGMNNRRSFERRLKELDQQNHYPLSVIFCDINGLKLINDAFGHQQGDKMLIEAAKTIESVLPENGFAARIGGDEFTILLPNTNTRTAQEIIHKLNKKASEVHIESIALSISFGVDTKTSPMQDIQMVCRSAEDKMYRLKLFQIPSMRSDAIETIVSTLNEKDTNSKQHSQNVAIICEGFASFLSLDNEDIQEIRTAALLHDIGKIIIPDSILNKKGKLTEIEYETMKQHPEIGFRILNSTQNMRDISHIVLHHHEHWDGGGYPSGISGEDIPLKSRIISIADAYDAMTTERYYREIMSKQDAIKELIAFRNIQFDPELVDKFVTYLSQT